MLSQALDTAMCLVLIFQFSHRATDTQHARIHTQNGFSTFKLPSLLKHAKIFFHLFKQLVESCHAIVVGRFYFLLIPLFVLISLSIFRNKHERHCCTYKALTEAKELLVDNRKISLLGLCFNFSFLLILFLFYCRCQTHKCVVDSQSPPSRYVMCFIFHFALLML